MYTDRQRQTVHESVQRLQFQDPAMRQFAEAGYMSSDDVTAALGLVRKLIRTDNPDTEKARSLLKVIKPSE